MAHFGRRILALVPVLLSISFLTFTLMALIPGDPAVVMLGADATPDAIEALRETLGLNKPFPLRYLWWLGNALKGDLGLSLYQHEPVAELVAQRIPTTLLLCVLATIVSIVVGIPTGVLSAVRRNKTSDHVIRLLSLVGFAMPNFWAGLLLTMAFSVMLPIFPITGFVSPQQDFVGSLKFFVLPSLALGLTLAGFLSRLTRSSMLDVLQQDYTRTAWAKGLKHRTIVYRHALRNALMPLVTVIGLNFGVLLGGSVVMETVFNLPGVGRLIVHSISQRDFPLVQGSILYVALFYAIVNVAVDLVYGYLDPRVRFG